MLSVLFHKISKDQLGFVVTVIPGNDSINKTLSSKELDTRNHVLFFFFVFKDHRDVKCDS
jgi:hypothetical protein